MTVPKMSCVSQVPPSLLPRSCPGFTARLLVVTAYNWGRAGFSFWIFQILMSVPENPPSLTFPSVLLLPSQLLQQAPPDSDWKLLSQCQRLYFSFPSCHPPKLSSRHPNLHLLPPCPLLPWLYFPPLWPLARLIAGTPSGVSAFTLSPHPCSPCSHLFPKSQL